MSDPATTGACCGGGEPGSCRGVAITPVNLESYSPSYRQLVQQGRNKGASYSGILECERQQPRLGCRGLLRCQLRSNIGSATGMLILLTHAMICEWHHALGRQLCCWSLLPCRGIQPTKRIAMQLALVLLALFPCCIT